ncbi:MAG: proton-conducting transporter membrane subunit [Polyangiaceae bacterium]
MMGCLTLPLLIPLFTAIATLFARRARGVQRALSAAGAAGLLAASVFLLRATLVNGIQGVQVGGWPAPFGITLAADVLAAGMVLLAGLTGALGMLYSLGDIDARRERAGYHTLYHLMLLGVCGAFVAGDLFNLYVWFEVMLVASFALLSLGGEPAQIEGAMKYVSLSLISSALFLSGLGLFYGLFGTLNMAHAAVVLRSLPPGKASVVSMVLLLAFGIKAALFPLYFWLPASYPAPPVPVAAVLAGLLSKVGVYAIVRTFTLLFVGDGTSRRGLFLVAAGLTMVSGVLGAVSQGDVRRILAFHSVSQMGYMMMGLGLSSRSRSPGQRCSSRTTTW